MEKVSIIMPCFNDGEYINESINSVLNQTYENIELIIIDDGSTDKKTIEILDNIKHPKIKILKTDRLKPSGARNKGIEIASGKYILPLDADDIIDPTYIEKAINIMESDSNIGIVYCEAELFGKKNGYWNLPEYSIENMLINNIIFVSAMFNKKDWEIVGGFDESLIYGLEDYDFWLSILELDKKVVKIPEILFKYRIKSTSRNKSFEDDIDNVKETYKKIYTNHSSLYSKYKDEYIIALRNCLIDQSFIRKKRIDKIKKIPLISIILKNEFIKNKLKFLFLQ